MISKLFLDKNFDGYKAMFSDNNALENLSQINIFIGENNSGKSRFLRKIYTLFEYNINTTKFSFEEIQSIIESVALKVKSVVQSEHKIEDVELKKGNISKWILHSLVDLLPINYFPFNNVTGYINKLYELFDILSDGYRANYKNKVNTRLVSHPGPDLERKLNAIGTEFRIQIMNIVKPDYEEEYHKTYIPILRGVRPIQNMGSLPTESYNIRFGNDDVYSYRTLKDYIPFIKDKKPNVFTGLTLYEDIKANLLNNVDKRNQIRDFENFLSNTFFNGAKISLIPHIDNDVLHIGIDDDEKEIYNLGDGIQTLIILLYPLFIHRGKNMIFCIEEPENHLHPGMQRIFLEALRNPEFSTFQYFITTHSNHFLDLTLDVSNTSVYTFKKKKDVFEIENVSHDDYNILELIGARTSSVFLSNCTVWVEGVTDRLYIKKYFDRYQKIESKNGNIPKIYLEDIHYSFVEYGGNNITHWSFLDEDDGINVDRLCAKLFLITDNDGAEEAGKVAKKERFEKLQEKLKERYYCLQVREVENLIPKECLKKYIRSKEKDSATLDFAKFDKNDYHNTTTQLGKFIENNITGIERKYKESEKSNTIRNKVEVCKSVIEYIDENMQVVPEVDELCKKLYDFIKKNNS